MRYQVLARKWRPATFNEVVGQSHVVDALSNALNNDRVHHAFLFTGTRGVGKTTIARIFAKSLNCFEGVSANPCGECTHCTAVSEGRFLDLIEVDAASRTKVDDTRDLLDNVQYAPTQGRYKVYLIDEVHMLSTHSFNALLKTLEEPPEHVKFLLATTDPQKLPMTILSRCIQFTLHSMDQTQIVDQLSFILDKEGIDYQIGGLKLIARGANGSMRDALSLLDQAIAYSNANLTQESVRAMLGLMDSAFLQGLADAFIAHDGEALMDTVNTMVSQSVNFDAALDDLLELCQAASLANFAPKALAWKPELDTELVTRFQAAFDAESLQLFYQLLLIGKRDLPYAPEPRIGFEMVLLRCLAFYPGISDSGQSKPTRATNTAPGHSSDGQMPARTQIAHKAPAQQTSSQQAEATQRPMNRSTEQQPAQQRPDQLASPHENSGMPSAVQEPQQNYSANANSGMASQVNQSAATTSAPAAPHMQAQTNSSAGQSGGSKVAPQSTVDTIGAWSQVIQRTALKGMTKQLAMHLAPSELKADTLKCLLSDKYQTFNSADRRGQIEKEINRFFSNAVTLEVTLGEVQAERTAAGYQAQETEKAQTDMRDSYVNDPVVQKVVEQFDAKIDLQSIHEIDKN